MPRFRTSSRRGRDAHEVFGMHRPLATPAGRPRKGVPHLYYWCGPARRAVGHTVARAPEKGPRPRGWAQREPTCRDTEGGETRRVSEEGGLEPVSSSSSRSRSASSLMG